jgi:hypothetical protein
MSGNIFIPDICGTLFVHLQEILSRFDEAYIICSDTDFTLYSCHIPDGNGYWGRRWQASP